jgi:hypothetical protein
MKNLTLLPILFLALLLAPSPAFAGPSFWNSSNTFAAYIDYVAPGSEYLSDKTVFFYNEQLGERFRGTYFPLGAHLSGVQIGYLPADQVSLVRWVNDYTVLVETSNSWDDANLKAFYEIQTDGLTRFVRFENLRGHENEVPQNVPDEWDLLIESEKCVQFITDLCAGRIEQDEENMPLEHQEFGMPANQVRKLYFDGGEIWPVRYVMPDYNFDDDLYVQGQWSNRFGIQVSGDHPVLQWYSQEDI